MSKPVVLIGGGAHCRVVLEAARLTGLPVAGIIDPSLPVGQVLDGSAVLGDDSWLRREIAGRYAYHVSLTDPTLRAKLRRKMDGLGFSAVTIIHPGATVSAHARLGAGCFVAVGAIVNIGATLGPGVVVNTRAAVDHDCAIGADCHLTPGVVLAGGVRCGTGVFIGINAAVGQYLKIGDGAVVAAGATVLADIPPRGRAYGTPARVRKDKKVSASRHRKKKNR